MASKKPEFQSTRLSKSNLARMPQKCGRTHHQLSDSWRTDTAPNVLVVDMDRLDGLSPERKALSKRVKMKTSTKATSRIVISNPNRARIPAAAPAVRLIATSTKIPKPVSKVTETRRAAISNLTITVDTDEKVDLETRIRRALNKSVRFKDETIGASKLNPMAKEFSSMKASHRPKLKIEIPNDMAIISKASSEPLSGSTKVGSASTSPSSTPKTRRPVLNYDTFRPIRFPPPGLPVPDPPGREAKHMDPKLANPLLEKFTERYPLTGSRKPAIIPPKSTPPAPTPAKRQAAVIQQRLELLLLQEKEKKAIEALVQSQLLRYIF
ncbi:hypothetical protein BP5796_10962 [Coleophoma crateriformis]|uniref:Uncharacterized protein n=1 Tax=Coleophoma crateriformis TaxID=565419 RepID=A0A3D8QLY7_9HELO|nr:hypothetical protein BP5796_10962 [Coleophoma crateriformis]